MAAIKLKKIIAQKDISSLLNNLITSLGGDISIQDIDEQLLFGDEPDDSSGKYKIDLKGSTLGWVRGGENARPIAALLNYLANRELERRAIAIETLENYREINLLYNLSRKLTANLMPQDVAQIVINQTRELIPVNRGFLFLLDQDKSQLEVLASFDSKMGDRPQKQSIAGIVRSVIMTGVGEIVNDVSSDPRFVPSDYPISSLMCVPLKTKDQVIGVIELSSEQPVDYTARDLKLISALASQATSAISNAILYENMLREERVRSTLNRYF